jgi:hypothetical protein
MRHIWSYNEEWTSLRMSNTCMNICSTSAAHTHQAVTKVWARRSRVHHTRSHVVEFGWALPYKRLCLLPWVPISTSCGFGTQCDLCPCAISCQDLFTNILSPWVAGVHHDPLVHNHCLLSAQLVSSRWKSHSTVVGVVCPHFHIELGWRLGDHCHHTYQAHTTS